MRLSRALVLVIGLLGGCAHGPTHRPGEEWLAGVDFEGNHQLSRSTLLTGLALHRTLNRGGAPDPYSVQLDADRIRGEYLRNGYLDVDVRARVERKGDAARVIYTIEEGKRAGTRIEVTGLPDDVSADSVRAKLPLHDGTPFDYQAYDLAKPLLLAVVQDAGYAHARLDARVIADRADHTAVVELAYMAGPKCRFGDVEITGATGELATAVRERLAFSPGQMYSTSAITQTQRNLYGFGRFSTVQVQPERNGDGQVVKVKVAVAEGARREVQLGGGFGVDPTSYEVRGRAGYSIAGWPFPLDTVTIDLRPAYAYLRAQQNNQQQSRYEPRVRALARLERKDLFWTYTKGAIEAGYNYLAIDAYTSHGPLARVGFETPLGTSRVQLRVGWRFQEVWFRRINPLIEMPPVNIDPMIHMIDPQLKQHLGLDRAERIGAFEQALVVDLRDHPLEPTLGAYGELRTTEGARLAGGAYDYLQLIGDGRGYVPLIGGAVLAARARYGVIRARAGNVPPTERFFAGGAVSQRGFGERQLAPTATALVRTDPNDPNDKGTLESVVYGGTQLLETSLEARIPIMTIRNMPLGVVTFLDGGDVTNAPDSVNPARLHWAVGGGLRLMTVVGPVRLDVAYRLNRTTDNDPEPRTKYTYHLTIGEAF